jgi:cytidine deaminase
MGQLHTITFPYEELDREELTADESFDLALATEARFKAYAPYSHFKCGVVIRTKDGRAVPGWNVENVIYEVLHAEKDALGKLEPESRASGLRHVITTGGVDGSNSEEICAPCGFCRQDLLEFVRPADDPVVIMAGVRGRVIRVKLKDLLPFAFYPALIKT